MIERVRTLSLLRRHPRSEVFSHYLDGDLDAEGRRAIEDHVRDCPRCQRELASLTDTLEALGSLEADGPAGLADSIITALRAEPAPDLVANARSSGRAALPQLTIVPRSGQQTPGKASGTRGPIGVRAALHYCVERAQLRVTLPITVVAGIVLSMVNMGGTLVQGRIDVGMCAMCAADFLVPFLALNIVLVMVVRAPRRRRM